MSAAAIARQNMVENQLRPNRVQDAALVRAMEQIPREMFVPAALKGLAYMDDDLPLGSDRWLMEPMVLARMIEAAGITPACRVLDVGGATGYSTAILSRLARHVTLLEADAALARQAETALKQLSCPNTAVMQGDMTQGSPDGAPYDVILVNGAVEQVPQALSVQLADGGRLVTVVLSGGQTGRACLFRRTGTTISDIVLFDAGTPLLPGFEKPAEFEF
ncbi:MAG: protein-L-isoaspartate O-methyltransferase [Pseudomonadota bacterium]|nr:protein-L-isoaspartate O-methyltransferase [Pseudomonadota bacterium]